MTYAKTGITSLLGLHRLQPPLGREMGRTDRMLGGEPIATEPSLRCVPGYGERLSRTMKAWDLTTADLGLLSCLSSATILRAVNKDLVTPRTQMRISAALARLRRSRRARADKRSTSSRQGADSHPSERGK